MGLTNEIARRLRPNSRAARLLRPIVNRILPSRPIAVRVLSGPGRGIRLLIEPRAEKYYWTGTHDTEVQGAINTLLRPGDVFWDIGAHIGFFTLLGSRLVGSKGAVHAFEPLGENFARLERGLELNRANNVTAHQLAISDRVGSASLFHPNSSLMASLLESSGPFELVPCTTLDDLAASLGKPDVIKVDVEGAELMVFGGGARLLGSARPVLIVELLSAEARARAENLLDGYTFRQLDFKNWLATPGSGR